MADEFQYVRTGWTMGIGDALNVGVHVDSKHAEKFTDGQWKSLGIEVEKHMKAILDFLKIEIWPERQEE